jgi:hypothetical protein
LTLASIHFPLTIHPGVDKSEDKAGTTAFLPEKKEKSKKEDDNKE